MDPRGNSNNRVADNETSTVDTFEYMVTRNTFFFSGFSIWGEKMDTGGDGLNFGGAPWGGGGVGQNTYKEYIVKRDIKLKEFGAMTDKCPTCAKHHCSDRCQCSGTSVGHCPPYADPEIQVDESAGTISFSYYGRMGNTTSMHGKSGDCAVSVIGDRQKLVLRLLKGDDDDPDFHAGIGPMVRHFHGIVKRIDRKKAEKERLVRICLGMAQEVNTATGWLMQTIQSEAAGEAPDWSGYVGRLWGVADSMAGRSLQSTMHIGIDEEEEE